MSDELREGVHVSDRGVHLEPIGNGVARVSWSAALQAEGFDAASTAVREEVTLALEEPQAASCRGSGRPRRRDRDADRHLGRAAA